MKKWFRNQYTDGKFQAFIEDYHDQLNQRFNLFKDGKDGDDERFEIIRAQSGRRAQTRAKIERIEGLGSKEKSKEQKEYEKELNALKVKWKEKELDAAKKDAADLKVKWAEKEAEEAKAAAEKAEMEEEEEAAKKLQNAEEGNSRSSKK